MRTSLSLHGGFARRTILFIFASSLPLLETTVSRGYRTVGGWDSAPMAPDVFEVQVLIYTLVIKWYSVPVVMGPRFLFPMQGIDDQ